MFDPYRKWLGIPEEQCPPTHYQLLGISPDEWDLDVIEAAVLRQSSFVRNFQTGKHAEDATRILNEIATARLCLVDPQKRARYDAELRKQHAPKPPSHSSARHSDLNIPVAAIAPPTHQQPASRPAPPTVDLDRLIGPAPRRVTPHDRLGTSRRGPALARPRTHPGSTGYIWQVPLLTVILIILMLIARTIGRTIAEQRAQHARPIQVQIND